MTASSECLFKLLNNLFARGLFYAQAGAAVHSECISLLSDEVRFEAAARLLACVTPSYSLSTCGSLVTDAWANIQTNHRCPV